MSQIVAMGDGERLRGFELAGVEVIAADDSAAARAAWDALPADVALVILTPDAHAALAAGQLDLGRRLWVVLPQ